MTRRMKRPDPPHQTGRKESPPPLDSLEERLASGTREERREALEEAVGLQDRQAGDLVARMFVDGRLDDLDRDFPPPSVMMALAKLGISRKMQGRLLDNMLQRNRQSYYSGLVIGEAADGSAIPAVVDVIDSRREGTGLPFLDSAIGGAMTGAAVDCIVAMHRRRIDCSGAVEPLIRLLGRAAEPDLRIDVIGALAELGNPRAGEHIWRAMAQMHPFDRKLAQESLRRLNYKVPKKGD